MASEYSVNIRLNTAQVKKDLKTIGSEISNLGKKESKSSKKALSTTDKRLKTETQIANLQKRTQSIRNSILKLDLKGAEVSQIKSKLTRADNQAESKKFDLSKKNIALALRELEILKQQTIEVGKQAKARGGNTFKFPMGASSPLNFGPGGQLLPGPVKGRGFDFQSALISGGFPLLFGQGPVVGAAGALGGGIGGMFGQMGGFAGGIAATTIAQTLQTFTTETAKLGSALNDATKDITAVSEALGITGTKFEKNLKALEALGDEEAAFEAARQKMIDLVGKDGVEAMQRFGEQSVELGNEFKKAMTIMRAGFATFFEQGPGKFILNRLTAANLQKQAQVSTDPAVKQAVDILKAFQTGVLRRSSEQRQLIKDSGFTSLSQAAKNVESVQSKVNQAAEDKANKELDAKIKALENDKKTKNTENINFKIKSIETEIKLRELNNNLLNNEVVSLKESLIAEEHKVALAEAKGDEDLINLANAEKANKLSILSADIAKAELDLAKEFNDEQEKRNRLRDQEAKRIQAIKDSAEARILDIEKENELREFALTATAEEIAFKKIVLSLSKDELAFIDEKRLKQAIADSERITALERQKQIIDEIQFTLASSMSDAIKGLITGTHSLNSALSSVLNKMADAMLNMGLFGNVGGSLEKGGGLLGTIFKGFLHAGGPAKGGRSYIVGEKGPEMFTPGVSGMVTPNSALGGSNNIVVNVDASGTQVEGDEASSSQLGKLIGLAVQQELVKQSRAGGLLSKA